MGWLDNSTNNIILDAVLTDYGRQALARNNGSFSIAKFALGDDEVNYTTIQKYGRTVGREKIEKNTPVFEAFTNQNLSLKYKLVSAPTALLYLPQATYTIGNGNSSATNVVINVSNSTNTARTITVTQSPAGTETSIPPNLIDSNYNVMVPDLFLSIAGEKSSAPDVNKIVMYTLAAPAAQNTNNRTLTFTLQPKVTASSTTLFTVYGQTIGALQTIKTLVRIVGLNSGTTIDIPVEISK